MTTVIRFGLTAKEDAREIKHITSYDDVLSRKIDAARVSTRAGLGRTNEEIEAKFAWRNNATGKLKNQKQKADQ